MTLQRVFMAFDRALGMALCGLVVYLAMPFILLGVLILPAFTGSPPLSFPVRLSAFVVAGITESLALILLRYIP